MDTAKRTKKIGCVIIMHPGQNNYGSSLQGFAAITMIGMLGYDYEIIKYKKQRNLIELFRIFPDLIRSGIIAAIIYKLKKKLDFLLHKEYAKTRAVRRNAVDAFKDKYLNSVSRTYTGYKALQKGSLNYSSIMVGSDQVWGPLSLFSKFYNLLFVDESIPKFSYASSFGVSEVIPCQRHGVADYLNRIDYIGVRELQGKKIVESISNKKATVVLDPTFLLTKEDWSKYINEERCKINEPYTLCYILGNRPEIRDEINKFKKESNIKIVFLPHIDNYIASDNQMGDLRLFDVDPFDFLRLVRDAKYVITDSFHGSVFSILFQKKFITFYRQNPKEAKSTHSRIDSLFEILGLQDRLFQKNIYSELEREVNYTSVEERIVRLRNDSLGFLKDCLKMSEVLPKR